MNVITWPISCSSKCRNTENVEKFKETMTAVCLWRLKTQNCSFATQWQLDMCQAKTGVEQVVSETSILLQIHCFETTKNIESSLCSWCLKNHFTHWLRCSRHTWKMQWQFKRVRWNKGGKQSNRWLGTKLENIEKQYFSKLCLQFQQQHHLCLWFNLFKK